MSRATETAKVRVKNNPDMIRHLRTATDSQLKEFTETMVAIAQDEAPPPTTSTATPPNKPTGTYMGSITHTSKGSLHRQVYSECGYGYWVEVRWKPVFAIAAQRAHSEVFG